MTAPRSLSASKNARAGSFAINGGQRPKGVTLDTFFDSLELCFGLEPVSGFRDSPVVFRAELSAEFPGAVSQNDHNDSSYQGDYNHRNHCDLCRCHASSL